MDVSSAAAQDHISYIFIQQIHLLNVLRYAAHVFPQNAMYCLILSVWLHKILTFT
jgi:hypothetical protein